MASDLFYGLLFSGRMNKEVKQRSQSSQPSNKCYNKSVYKMLQMYCSANSTEGGQEEKLKS